MLCDHIVSVMPFPLYLHKPEPHRVKRFISKERTIEILVMSDPSMLHAHKTVKSLQTYVNTLIASVSARQFDNLVEYILT